MAARARLVWARAPAPLPRDARRAEKQKPVDAADQTRWWHKKEGDDGKIVCTLCPRECHIPEGSRGFCFVRANEDGQMVLTTYGRSSGYCIDPIEKKPLNHFLPGTPVLSFGTAGCNLGCKFCQNWDISKSHEMDRVAEQAVPEAIIDAAERTGCRSVAFTYNDPVIWAEYAIDIAKVARRRGIKTVAVTAGYITPDARKEFYKWMDAANVDLKAFTETFYRKLTQTHLEPVLDTLKYLKHETDVWFEITNLMIPGENDSREQTQQMCRWIVENLGDDVPVHFTAFHPDFKMMDKPRTPPQTLVRARRQALEAGIKYAYVGNVNDVAHQSTFCPSCGALLIERDWYELGTYGLKGSACGRCGTTIPGLFEQTRGDWGRKRVPIRIGQPAVGPTVSATSGGSSGSAPAATRFTPDQERAVVAYARALVENAARGESSNATLEPALEAALIHGVFVTLKRGTLLRGCRGRWADPTLRRQDATAPLVELVASVARDTALDDTRFASIQPHELPLLGIEVSVMHDFQTLTRRGANRAASVQVGTHGVVLQHPRGRGLLLPQVATENKWDVQTFLSQLCRKAGLDRPDAWQDDGAAVMTFQAAVLTGEAPKAELNPSELDDQRIAALLSAARAVLEGAEASSVEDELLTRPLPHELGLHLETTGGLSGVSAGFNQSLLALARSAARSLRELFKKQQRAPEPIAVLSLLWQAIRLQPADYPDRHGTLGASAVLAEAGAGRWSFWLPPKEGLADQVGQALHATGMSQRQWQESGARVTAFTVNRFGARRAPNGSRGPAGRLVRSPAQAGRFYPGQADQVAAAVERHMAAAKEADGRASACRAVMLPHAGWLYCGDTIAKTIGRVKVPDKVIVIGPKHTPHGAAWSIAPHDVWELPGFGVPIERDLAGRLLKRVATFVCEPEAHRVEHGTEVLLPFLCHMNPQVQVLPVVLGAVRSYDDLVLLGDALAQIVTDSQEPPLLVISSDMNHFAAERENRRLDHLALEAMQTGDARQLFDVVMSNNISMCGVHPAVAVMLALSKLSGPPSVQLVDYRNSAAVSGDTSSVVGYAGVVLN